MRAWLAGLACMIAFAAPAEAATRYAAAGYSFEVPGGWRATRGKAADEVMLFAPGSKTEYIHVTPHPGGKRSLDGAPAWAKRGAAKLGGVPARTAVWDVPAGRDAITTVVVQASRNGRDWGVSAVYRRPDGDLVMDRHWNIPMALVVRTWRWEK